MLINVIPCTLESSLDDDEVDRPLTRDSILVAEQPELVDHAEHLDDVAREERQLLGDAGEKLKDRPDHRAHLHHSSPGEREGGRERGRGRKREGEGEGEGERVIYFKLSFLHVCRPLVSPLGGLNTHIQMIL